MIEGSCHCGAVTLAVPRKPKTLTSCNCSICRRIGGLWAYYNPARVKISGKTDIYVWGDRTIDIHRCKRCGCTTHWSSRNPAKADRMGINMRLADPVAIEGVRVRRFDGAETWKFLD